MTISFMQYSLSLFWTAILVQRRWKRIQSIRKIHRTRGCGKSNEMKCSEVRREKLHFLLCLFCLLIVTAESSIPEWITDRMSRNQNEREYFLKETRIGLKKGLGECRRQFRWQRWNCQFSERVKSKIMARKYAPKVTKEVAFLNAMTSSSIAVHLAMLCRRGEANLCWPTQIDQEFFNSRLHNQEEIREEQTNFGLWITEYFTDNIVLRYSQRLARQLAIRHNNKIGRNVVKYMAKRSCMCHGASGMCMLKTCAGIMPSLKEIGTTLKFLYSLSHKGHVDSNNVLKPSSENRPVKLSDMLIYLTDSTDYCKKNKSYGSLGTLGRICRVPLQRGKRSSMGNCEQLCSSCGFATQYTFRLKKVRCNCKFRWCCLVDCKTCERKQNVVVCSEK